VERQSIPEPARDLAGGKEAAVAIPLLQRLKHIEQGEAANHVRVQARLLLDVCRIESTVFSRERGSKTQHALELALTDDPRSGREIPKGEERSNVRQSGTDGVVPDRDEIDAQARLAHHAPARARHERVQPLARADYLPAQSRCLRGRARDRSR